MGRWQRDVGVQAEMPTFSHPDMQVDLLMNESHTHWRKYIPVLHERDPQGLNSHTLIASAAPRLACMR